MLKLEMTSQKQYKGRFRKWGIRKNINVQKAREIMSAEGAVCDFWPDKMQDNYDRRIARHLRNDTRSHTCSPQSRSPRPGGKVVTRQQPVSPWPARLKAPDNLERLEKTLYDTEAYIHFTIDPRRTWLVSREELGDDDRFFPLFIEGLEALSRDHEHHKAFSEIREASKHLKGLITLDDPAVYHRLVLRLSSFERYPQSDICFQVCRLLARCLGAMNLEIHGPSHPLTSIWSSHIEALDSRPEPGLFHHYLELVRAAGGKLYGDRNSLNIGSTELSKYISSSYREWDEEALRRRLTESTSKATPDPAVQEIRLALTEVLLRQGKAEDAIKLLEEATASKGLNARGDVGQIFWMAELEWRAGNATASFALLRKALELADSGQTLPGLVDAAQDEERGLSSLHILHTLFLRQNLMGRKQEITETRARATSLLAARRHRKSFILHLTSSDFEFDLDAGFDALAIADWSAHQASPLGVQWSEVSQDLFR